MVLMQHPMNRRDLPAIIHFSPRWNKRSKLQSVYRNRNQPPTTSSHQSTRIESFLANSPAQHLHRVFPWSAQWEGNTRCGVFQSNSMPYSNQKARKKGHPRITSSWTTLYPVLYPLFPDCWGSYTAAKEHLYAQDGCLVVGLLRTASERSNNSQRGLKTDKDKQNRIQKRQEHEESNASRLCSWFLRLSSRRGSCKRCGDPDGQRRVCRAVTCGTRD